MDRPRRQAGWPRPWLIATGLALMLAWNAGCGSSAPYAARDLTSAETATVPTAATPEAQETQLSTAIAELLAQEKSGADDATLAAGAGRVQALAGNLARGYRTTALAGTNENLKSWLLPREAPPQRNPADLARLSYGAADEGAVNACWRRQVHACVVALGGLEARDRAAVGLWQYWQDGQDGREAGLPFFRAEAIRNTAADLAKLLELLQHPPPLHVLEPGELIFEDNFVALAANWKGYGNPEMKVADGRLTITGEACTVWLERDFENVVIAFDYTPLSLEKNAGALFAFPGRPLPGSDWNDAAGRMENYNRKIETYHCSLCRGGSGMTNLRRTGTGLRMLSTVIPDPCATLKKTYRVELLSAHGSLYVLVDGVLQHAYLDAGVHGPILNAGRFGVRLFAGGRMAMQLGHFQVYKVQE